MLFSPDVFLLQARGGISRYHAELHAGLLEQGVRSRVFAGLHTNAHLADGPGVLGRRVARPLPAGRAVRRATSAAFDAFAATRGRATVLHPTYYTAGVPRVAGPVVVTVHDLIHARFPGDFPANDPTFAQQRRWVAGADRVIAVSQSTKADVVELLRVPEERVSVVPLGVARPAPAIGRATGPATAPATAPAGPDVGRRHDQLLYVGLRGGYKNWSTAVAALALPELAGLRLVCVGGGAFTAQESELLTRLGLQDRVRQETPTDEGLARLMRESAALVYPSRYEGFGLPPLEAMAHGLPVVAAAAASLPEVVGEAGVLFDPEDPAALAGAVVEVLGQDRRAALVAAGLARVDEFTWARTAQATAEVYAQVSA